MRDDTPPYFRFLVRLIRPFPDFDFAFITPLRETAAALLHLAPGGRVLDLGCGPGGSFPWLRDAVGSSGEVIGVEISPEVTINAQRRIERHGWTNVHVIPAPAETVELTGLFDGALMFGAPDVYGSAEALDNILPHLRPNARVVFFGAKTSRRPLGWVLNPLLRSIFPKLSFRTTPVPDDAPWRPLAARLHGLTIREYFFGWMFLAAGSFTGRPHEHLPGMSDHVRIRHTPITEAAGIAGLEGWVYGESVPSISGVTVVGPAPADFALNVHVDERSEGYWLAPEHVEFLDYGVGQEMRLDGIPKKFVRRADGGWDELPAE